MARGINKVILIGNCGQDPETRYTAGGSAVTHVSLATSETWKDKQTGQNQERTEWHRVVFFNRLAEIAGEYLRKGSKVYIEGSLRTNKWQDPQGQDRYTTEIVAAQMQMLDSRGEGGFAPGQGGAPAGQSGGYGGQPGGGQQGGPQGGQRNYGGSAASNQPPVSEPPGGMDNSFDDDIPF